MHDPHQKTTNDTLSYAVPSAQRRVSTDAMIIAIIWVIGLVWSLLCAIYIWNQLFGEPADVDAKCMALLAPIGPVLLFTSARTLARGA